MEVHDVPDLIADLPTLDLRQRPTFEEAMASSRAAGTFRGHPLRIARFSGQPPWEKHADEELIYVLDGEVTVTFRSPAGFDTVRLRSGSLMVVPAGTWHRSLAEERVTVLTATPEEGNETSLAADPAG